MRGSVVLAALGALCLAGTAWADQSEADLARTIGTHAPAGQIAAPSATGHTPLGTYAPGGIGGYVDAYKGLKKVLFIGDVSSGSQIAHDSITHAMASLERAARAEGIAIFMRTDTQLISKASVWGKGDYAEGGRKAARAHNLDDYDAIIFFNSGEMDLSDAQKADLLRFVAEDGKGFVGIHTAAASLYKWPAYGEMVGGYFDTHPWGMADAKIRVERPDFPGMKAFADAPLVRDEHYQFMAPYDRSKVDVLASIDTTSVDVNHPNVHRTDGDFPVAWLRNYGKGRVFYSYLGHADSAWDDARIVNMYLEGIKWALGKTAYPVRPHPLPPTKVK